MQMNDNSKASFWNLFGWCLVWIGFGSCVYLANQSGPIVSITFQQPTNIIAHVEK